MKIEITCTYCGYKIDKEAYNEASVRSLRCSKCNDKNLLFKEIIRERVDYYAGSPPFEEKKEYRLEYPDMKDTSIDKWGF